MVISSLRQDQEKSRFVSETLVWLFSAITAKRLFTDKRVENETENIGLNLEVAFAMNMLFSSDLSGLTASAAATGGERDIYYALQFNPKYSFAIDPVIK